MCVKGIEDALGISQSSISHSLKNLRQLDIVRVKKEGRFACTIWLTNMLNYSCLCAGNMWRK
nr:ArsR family transcriptional regulator [Methanolobus psychrotolerans]